MDFRRTPTRFDRGACHVRTLLEHEIGGERADFFRLEADAMAPAGDQGILALRAEIHIEPSDVLLGEIGACLTDEIQVIGVVVQ